MFRIPYRWKYPLKNIRSMFGDIARGVKNVIRWTPVIWFDADFDWDFLNDILIYKFKRMAKVLEASNDTRHAKQLRICAHLCERLGKDIYFQLADYRFPNRGKGWAQMVTDLGNQDEQLLGKIIAKHYRGWWN